MRSLRAITAISALAFIANTASPAAATEPASQTVEHEAPIVVELDHSDPYHGLTSGPTSDKADLAAELQAAATTSLSSPLGASAVNQSGSLQVAYDQQLTPPAEVKAVINSAISQWDEVIETSPQAPVVIKVIWEELANPNLLGFTGPGGLFTDTDLPTEHRYPAPLANTLLKHDLNGSDRPEITIALNAGLSKWHIGTDTEPGDNQVDLYSIVLHELAHGFGFLGSVEEGDYGLPTVCEPQCVAFDEAVRVANDPLLTKANPNAHLRSGQLFVDTGGQQFELHAPPNWSQGSSFSHFDEAAFPPDTPGALLTPSLADGETQRSIDAPTIGVLAKIGWPTKVAPAKPNIKQTQATPGDLKVTWETDLSQRSLPPETYKVEALRNQNEVYGIIRVPGSATEATINQLANGVNYSVRVTPIWGDQTGPAAEASTSLPSAPNKPVASKADGDSLTQTVTWQKPEGPQPSRYEIEKSTDGVNWLPIGTSGQTHITAKEQTGLVQYRIRAANELGISDWAYSIPVGVSNGPVRFLPLDGQVARIYTAYFGRLPDKSGNTHWLKQRAQGMPLSAVSEDFAASQEFQNLYGSLTDAKFLDLIYRKVLDRLPDKNGRTFWSEKLKAGTKRGEVMVGFTESEEYITRTRTAPPQGSNQAAIYRLYLALFGRLPDEKGLEHWENASASLEEISLTFAQSAEFRSKYGTLPPDRLVEQIYQNVLRRQPGKAGRTFWTQQLENGMSPEKMVIEFSQSTEFLLATGTLP